MGPISKESSPEVQAEALLRRFRQSLQDLKEELRDDIYKPRKGDSWGSPEILHIERLFREIMDFLRNATIANKRSVIPELIEILRDSENEYGIDDWVLCSLLTNAIDRYSQYYDGDDDDADAQHKDENAKVQIDLSEERFSPCDIHTFLHPRNEVVLAGAIIKVAPHLVFEYPTNRKPGGQFENDCGFPKLHTRKSNLKVTPFYQATEKGATAIMRCMIDNGGLFCKKQFELQPRERRQIIIDLMEESKTPLNSSHDLLIALLRRPEPAGRNISYIIEKASDHGSLGGLTTLLNLSPKLAEDLDLTPKEALGNSKDKGNSTYEVVEKVLEYRECREMFATTEHIVKALEIVEKVDSRKREGQRKTTISENGGLRLVNLLIASVTRDDKIDYRVRSKIIELDLINVWNQHHKKLEHDHKGLLHLAVRYQKPRFVRMFLRKFPESVTIQVPLLGISGADSKVYHALWHNNKRIERSSEIRDREDDKVKEEIRKALVSATIRQFEIESLPDVFQQSHQPVHELCFDLPHFNSKKYTISQFVESLINHRENAELLSYESTIQYAAFPVLDSNEASKYTVQEPRREHAEVFNVLRWLQKSKQVKRIIRLIVPDRLVDPHDETKIARYVKHFKVESLDWRFVDLSISVFSKEVKDGLTVLHLYWSGKQAVLSHWLSAEGIGALSKLSKLYIHIVEKFMIQGHFFKAKARLEAAFEKAKREMKKDTLGIYVSRDPWNSTHVVTGDLKEVAEKVVPKLAPFINCYREYVNMHPKRLDHPTRVAIIDNGILSMLPGQDQEPRYTIRSPSVKMNAKPTDKAHYLRGKETTNPRLVRTDTMNSDRKTVKSEESDVSDLSDINLEFDDEDDEDHANRNSLEGSVKHQSHKSQRTLWSRVKEGRSFVRDNSRVSPWLFASHPHGTQMANLICALDPLCEIYVAKVTDGRHGITSSRVAEAIHWAVSQKVDIISMSFAILEDNVDLYQACETASSQGIIILCSAHDEGYNLEKAWPADYGPCWTVAASDNYGKLLHNTRQKWDYTIPGVEVAAGVVPFLDSNDRISGSSVATAITAGLSSLILSCDNLAHYGQKESVPRERRRKKRLEVYLEKMLSSQDRKYIMLEKLGEINNKTLNGEHIVAEKLLKQWFNQAW